MALLPDGPYLLKVEHIGEPRVTQTGKLGRRLDLRLLGTDLMIYWFCGDAPNSAWTYRDAVEDWEHIDEMLGRTFLFAVIQERTYGKVWNRVDPPPLAEFIEGN